MTTLSIGKLRGLQHCATTHGALAVFALDHRGSLRRALHPEAPDVTTPAEMITFKQDIVAALAPATSAVLLDPEIGAAQFDVAANPDEQVWQAACAELSETCSIPWVVLSAGVSYETYLRRVNIACQAGASGVAAGRAIWKEAVNLKAGERAAFLTGSARQRMARVTALCDARARPWQSFYDVPAIGDDWDERY